MTRNTKEPKIAARRMNDEESQFPEVITDTFDRALDADVVKWWRKEMEILKEGPMCIHFFSTHEQVLPDPRLHRRYEVAKSCDRELYERMLQPCQWSDFMQVYYPDDGRGLVVPLRISPDDGVDALRESIRTGTQLLLIVTGPQEDPCFHVIVVGLPED